MCSTQKIMGNIPVKSLSEQLAKQKELLLSVWPTETGKANRDGQKIPELLQEKGSLTFPFCLSANPLSICTANVQTGI